jgi:hypothetical protein
MSVEQRLTEPAAGPLDNSHPSSTIPATNGDYYEPNDTDEQYEPESLLTPAEQQAPQTHISQENLTVCLRLIWASLTDL